ncbi:MAG: hypothetical protein LBR76_01160 [Oscillospiraceae bacterium]|nr:hypothetical protein [Oscillospiraceae bacterium]
MGAYTVPDKLVLGYACAAGKSPNPGANMAKISTPASKRDQTRLYVPFIDFAS